MKLCIYILNMFTEIKHQSPFQQTVPFLAEDDKPLTATSIAAQDETDAIFPDATSPVLDQAPASLLLQNCRLVNVHSGEIYRTDIAISGDRIVSIAAGAVSTADQVIDCSDYYAVPGLVEPHFHVDSTLVAPGELARVLLPSGTTTLFVDTTNVYYTGGAEAVLALIRSFDGVPLRAFFAGPSYCPLDPDVDSAPVDLSLPDLQKILAEPVAVGIGETVWSKIRAGDEEFLRRMAYCQLNGLRISGHGDGLTPGDDASYDGFLAAGVHDDHNFAFGPDIEPRLQRGMALFMVEAPGRLGQLDRLLSHAVTKRLPLRHACLCVDNTTIMDIVDGNQGHLDKLIRIARQKGVSAIDTIRMATLNAAEHYRKADLIGNIAPGRLADIVLVRDLEDFAPELVIFDGRVAVEAGKMRLDVPASQFPAWYQQTITLHPATVKEQLAVPGGPSGRARVRVMWVRDGSAFNRCHEEELPVDSGYVMPDASRDIQKIAMIERYGCNGNVSVAFAGGFGLKRGAMATSVSIPTNNLVAVGVSDDDMWTAIQRLCEIQGGFVVVADGRVLAETRLPIGGCLSDRPYEEVVSSLADSARAARSLGCQLENPLFTIADTVLCTVPELGLTDHGLVETRTSRVIPVVIGNAE